jgi:hypothetical protein
VSDGLGYVIGLSVGPDLLDDWAGSLTDRQLPPPPPLTFVAHIAYCVPLLKIADFLTAGVHLKILLADVSHLSHAHNFAHDCSIAVSLYRCVAVSLYLTADALSPSQLHAFLDASKSTLETLKWRVKYYSFLLKAVFTVLGVPLDKLEFVTGTSYQLTPEYTMDMYRWVRVRSTYSICPVSCVPRNTPFCVPLYLILVMSSKC